MSANPLSFSLPLPQATRWRHAVGALLLSLAALLLLYRQSAWAMVDIWWRSDTFAHGFLVLPLVLWLVWRQRQVLALQVPQPAPQLLPGVLLLGLLWLLGELALVNALTQWATVALLVLAVPAVLGIAVARGIAFPLLFAFFAVPLGEFLLPPFMDWTANVTIFALRHSGIPVFREGNSFVIPTGRWSVVEACSGVRYLIASFMVGTLFAYLSYRSWWRRALFMLVSLLVPIVANWLRAYLVVLLGYLSDNRLAAGVDHVLYGWVFFGVVIALMFVVGARWAEPPALPLPLRKRGGVYPGVHATSPAWLWLVAASVAVLGLLPQLALWGLERITPATSVPDLPTPATVVAPDLGARWPLRADLAPALLPAYQYPSLVLQAVYGTAQPVGVYVALYQQQRRGHRLVGSDNALLRANDLQWLLAARGSRSVRVGHQTQTLRTSSLRPADLEAPLDAATLRVWQIYWVHGHVTASDSLAKLYGAWSRLSGQRDDAAVLLVYAPQGVGGVGEAALASFWADNYGALDAWLRRASGSIATEKKEGSP